MKKIFPIILIIFMLIGLIGCGNSGKQLSGKYVAPSSDGPFSQIVSSMEFNGDTVTVTYSDTFDINAGRKETYHYTIEEGINSLGQESTNLRIINFFGSSGDHVLENIMLEDDGNKLMFFGGGGTWKRVAK